MEAVDYQIWYWYIWKSERFDFSDKKMAIMSFERKYGRKPRPAEIAVKRVPVDKDE